MTSASDRERGAGANGPEGYRRRRPLPAIVLLTVLAVFVVVVWVQVLTKHDVAADTTTCPAPPTSTASAPIDVGAPPATLGVKKNADDLAGTPPAAPKAVQVRVLNANGQRGQAGLVAAQLAQLGFSPPADNASANDPVYTSQNMQCHGQIRFGPAGVAGARTVELLAPCAELVQDGRKDAGVDLALGTAFTNINGDPSVTALLTALGKHAANPQAPEPSADQLSAARKVSC